MLVAKFYADFLFLAYFYLFRVERLYFLSIFFFAKYLIFRLIGRFTCLHGTEPPASAETSSSDS